MFNHCEFEDDEEVFEENRLLGEGMVGLVEEVTVRSREPPIVCVRKKIARPKQLKAHQQIMAAFIREVRVMRQVNHRHCVRFLGSYTDNESVNILSTPVADMDLAAFLDNHIGDREWAILYKGIDCLCNGLLYLHDNKIRHEDLKPQNVLVHGTNILLTDFGFSLDFSDDSVSTTTGRPSAWTIRYSAPEVLDSEPRNRASDIFSLGCVLVEMISGLYGRTLSEVKDYWKKSSNGQSSFARNPEATSSWLALLSDHPDSGRLKPIVDYLPELLATRRLDRPSAQTVVDRLYREMTYVILDQRLNQVATKHNCYSSIWDVLRPSSITSIKAACDMLFLQSKKTKPILDLPSSQTVLSTELDLKHVLTQVLEAYTLWKAIFTARSVQIPTPETQWLPRGLLPFQLEELTTVTHTRTIQISMVGHGHCPKDDRYFGSIFYILTFKVSVEGYEPSKLGAPFVDLSMAI
ncbi:uncharacterized protein J4E88_000235 [Alternaria novae-zelandiae]|uniref:uncharacterized protein n=1 Tax=Alternaria novae-zelandiae TaxID=430562 RepID=UPI0020C4468E|nr:uncharacterized protein J4E88_000235 [Alternaria novae-zelandiae]KAI4696063.1 hypothetical protein J4E88_000235 [Alternaria novae-zelandiae]